MARALRAAFAAFFVFVAFAAYYNTTSDALPLGSGPDRRAHDDVVSFIYEHGRLPEVPLDEDALLFTAYGGTRAFRPPLAYLTAAAVARAIEPEPDQREIVFRKGSVLYGALTVAVAFAALYGYFGMLWPAVGGALLLGLLPQFVFISSYNNDDAAAIFSGTLLLASMLYVFRRGATVAGAVALGISVGIVVLTKQSAWLLLPGAGAFCLALLRGSGRDLLRFYAVCALAAIVVCGWWLGSNVYHYGWDDPFLWRVTQEVAARHSQFPAGTEFGYAARGVGIGDLWLRNYDAFWTKTVHSTIGNLDLLRLRLGTWTYLLYGTVFAVGIIYALARAAGMRSGRSDNRLRAFEGLLGLMLVFQVLGYTLTNLYNDVQLQGKYLLPAVLAVWVLFLSALYRAATAVRERWFEHRSLCLGSRGVGRLALGIGLLVVLGTHLHAWLRHVVPFYSPPVYAFERGEFFAVQLPRESIVGRHDIESLDIDGTRLNVVSSGADAHFVVDLRRPEWCAAVRGNRVMRITLAPGTQSLFQVFFDDGQGFSEARSVHARYGPERNVIEFVYGLRACRALRIDPIDHAGSVTILAIELAELNIRELQPADSDRLPISAQDADQ